MDDLLKRRKLLKGKITRVQRLVDKALASESVNMHEIELYGDQVESLCTNTHALLEEIALACEEGEIEKFEEEFYECLDKLDSLKVTLKSANSNVQATSTRSNEAVSSSQIRDSEVNLPRIELPTFSGDFHQWLSFHDLFVASIHNNSKLNAVQKLQYLKLCVKGEAANLLQAIQVTEANYERAWQVLKKRYHNETEIVYAQLDRLFGQASLNQESASGLRKLIDTTTECVDSLKILKQPVEHWGCVLIYLIRKKLDPETLRQWEVSKVGDQIRSFDEFLEFLDVRARALAALGINRPKQAVHSSDGRKVQKPYPAAHHISSQCCYACNENHSIYKCNAFLSMNVDKRIELAKKHRLCFNCLRPAHFRDKCQSKPCTKCNKWHNTLLHYTKSKTFQSLNPEQTVSKEPIETVSASTLNHCSERSSSSSQILLPTAVIMVYDSHGYPRPCRALLDSASQSNLMGEDCMQRLGLQRQRANVTVAGLASTKIENSRGIVRFKIGSSCSDFSVETEAVILRRITCDLPQYAVSATSSNSFTHLKLADPWFFKPGQIDILLGAEIFAKVLLGGKCESSGTSAIALESVFGWVISGKVEATDRAQQPISVHHISCDVDVDLQKFWELESVPCTTKDLSYEEKKCEEHFTSTHFRDETGRFVVRLPFRDGEKHLGVSRHNAVQRLKQVERRLSQKPSESELYSKFMNEYIGLQHMQLIPEPISELSDQAYYLPHHAVGKEVNSHTKFRVVFDASAKTTTGISLNDQLLVGPTLQDSIVPILMRFRNNKVAVVADIAKMYRQIRIHPDDLDFQRIVWRNSSSAPMQDYHLLTVTYGTASAPYLATKCLQQLAEDEQARFPLAAEVLKSDFYMDDLMSGAGSVQDAQTLQMQLIKLLRSGGFELRKWSSNEQALLESVPQDLRETNLPLDIRTDDSVKTLGLNWHPATDCFSFRVNVSANSNSPTKRTILSDVARVFDPLGLLAPVIIKAKILLQHLWRLKLDWDDTLPEAICYEWQKFSNEFSCLASIKIGRCVTQQNAKYELHGFCDASEAAYAAVVYLRVLQDDKVCKTELLISKTKVAPIKPISIPRLELCGALLLAKLLDMVQHALRLKLENIHAWTDSTIVLCWLASESGRWKTFVRNRVARIQNILPVAQWHHISGEMNPADCASRGIYPSKLVTETLWWNGPNILRDATILSSDSIEHPSEEAQLEEKQRYHLVHVNAVTDIDILSRFSSLTKLKRVTAYCLRFIFNARSRIDLRKQGCLSTKELHDALMHLVRLVQRNVFSLEIQCLKANKPLPSKSNLAPLNPFLDSDGLLRVGGRLRHSHLSVDQRHPVLLPKSHVFTHLVVSHFHLVNLHAGPQYLQAAIQQQFWIISIRDVIRRFVRGCVVCVRQQASTASQMMGDLPSARITPTHAFLRCGVDYTGPFSLRVTKGRGRKQIKCYVALFVCFVTRAIHIELVSDLSTDAFLAALKRFISRRGKPSDIFSDCGTNFVGAKRKLSEFEKLVQSRNHNENVSNFLSNEGIMWHFNPPASPHMGGLWEAGVKSLKFHLKRVVGNIVFTQEDFSTVLTQIEACLNSRPLTPMSSDPNDYTALTPGHFLIGRPLTSLPEPSYEEISPNRLSKWQLSQRAFQHFWKRWQREYLTRLQQRPKWLKKSTNIQVGDLVLLKEDGLPPLKWNLGRIVATHPGDDDCVRVVTVKNAFGKLLKRSISKLCRLPLN